MSEMSDTTTQLHDWLAYRDELSRHATVADRVVRNVEALTLERPVRGFGRGRLLLVVAAVAALLFAGIGLPHVLLRSHPGGTYAPAGPPAGVPDRRPPAGIALEWVPDPDSTKTRIIAYDRGGHAVGWMPLDGPLMNGDTLPQSGDGQRLLLTDYNAAGMMEMTAQGHRIALKHSGQDHGNTFTAFDVFFSDDDRSVCMDQGEEGAPRNLVVFDPAGTVARSFPEAPADNPAYRSWHTVTCSVRNDVAVLIGEADPRSVTAPAPKQSNPPGMGSIGTSVTIQPVQVPPGQPDYVVRVVRLSTGAELARRSYGPQDGQPFDATDDGTLVLEHAGQFGQPDMLRNIVSGAVTRTFHLRVQGLFGDYAITEMDGSSASDPRTHMLIDVRNGQTVWQSVLPAFSQVSFLGHGRAVLATRKFMGPVCREYEVFEVRDFTDGSNYSNRLDACPEHPQP